MSWARVYRVALGALPVALRRKHGAAMESLFAREVERARTRGAVPGMLAGAAGVWDVVRRSAYEHGRGAGVADGHAQRAATGLERHLDPHGPSPTTPDYGDSPMPALTPGQLLRRHAISFACAFVVLTTALVTLSARHHVDALRERGEPASAIVALILLSLPFISAMTLPMSVLVSVLFEFTRLGKDGMLHAVRREPAGVRRLVLPVLLAAGGVAIVALVVTASVVPRTNGRLAAVLSGREVASSDRTMSIGELRAAAHALEPDRSATAIARSAGYEVEVQKKLALPGACVALAVLGVVLALRFPRGGSALVIGVSVLAYAAYYSLIATGEHLADQLVVSPFVGMWGANAVVLAAALLVAATRRPSGASSGLAPLTVAD